jgi:NAD(P)-dependent dehydrogenase (short-subunit alcohol dehydrogenase family)
LVNCAGVARDRYISRLTDEDWSESLAVNLSTPLYLTRSVIPLMKAQGGGSLLNVLSYAGFRGNAGQAAYSASQAGLDGLTKTAVKELARFGIRVNAISPIVETDMTRGMTDERLGPHPLGALR